MPITARFDGSAYLLGTYLDKLENVDPLLLELAETLVVEINQRVPRDSEQMAEIITRIRGPYGTPEGRAIGIGDATLVGPRGARAPTGTIKEFLKWYRDTQMDKREDKLKTAPPEEIERPRVERPLIDQLRKLVLRRRGLEKDLTKVQTRWYDLSDRLEKTRSRISDLRRFMYEADPTTKQYSKWGQDLARAQVRERGQSAGLQALSRRMWDLSDRINEIQP